MGNSLILSVQNLERESWPNPGELHRLQRDEELIRAEWGRFGASLSTLVRLEVAECTEMFPGSNEEWKETCLHLVLSSGPGVMLGWMHSNPATQVCGELHGARVRFQEWAPGRFYDVLRVVPVRDDTDRNLYLMRIFCVLGLGNFSYVLRNNEHLVNWVLCGSWISPQVKDENCRCSVLKKLSQELRDRDRAVVADFPQNLKIPEEDVVKMLGADGARFYSEHVTLHRRDVDRERTYLLNLFGESHRSIVSMTHLPNLDEAPDPQKHNNPFVVLIVGPTGVGKSRLINVMFNLPIAPSSSGLRAVTLDVNFYHGTMHCPFAPDRHIVVIDAMGFCDSVWKDTQILGFIKDRVNLHKIAIHCVVFVCGVRFENSHRASFTEMVKWLRLTSASVNTLLVTTNRENDNDFDRANHLNELIQIAPFKDIFGAGCVSNLQAPGSTNVCTVPRALAVGFPSELDAGAITAQRGNRFRRDRERLLATVGTMSMVKPIEIDESWCSIL